MASKAARIISNGILKRDGGSIFGATPKAVWENSVNADRKNRGDSGDGSEDEDQDNNRDEAEG